MKINLFNSLFISRLSRADRINILIIIAIWLFMAILVNPLGDFPLNDDWVYGLAVKSILEKGDFRLPSPASANVFTQAFWGALFCLPFGFSFTALRFSTLTLGLIGVLVTYALLRETNASSKIALLGALLIAINPIYFGLSNTFMTDVPFYAFFVLSFYLLIQGLKQNSNLKIVIGVAISYLALLIRQFGIVIPLAFGVTYLVRKGFNWKIIIKGFSPTLLGISIQVFYQKWLYTTSRTPLLPLQNSHYQRLLTTFSKDLVHSFSGLSKFVLYELVFLIYLGLFIFPFVIMFFPKKFQYSRQRFLLLFGFSSFFIVVFLGLVRSQNHKRMPLLENILVDYGLGPLTLRDTFILKLNSPLIPVSLKIFWLVVTVIGVVGAAILLYYLLLTIITIFGKSQTQTSEKWFKVLIISAALIYILLIGSSIVFDRYLLPLLPLFMMIIVASTRDINEFNLGSSNKITSLVLTIMLIYGVFTIGATHDYLAWNRTRWQALDNLIKEDRILPNRIDGGYEFNGWYLYDFNYNRKRKKSWWWVDNDDYVISSGPISGYEEVKRYPFRRWLLLSQGNILVLHKITAANAAEP